MKLSLSLLFLSCFIGLSVCLQTEEYLDLYKGYKLYKVKPQTVRHVAILNELKEKLGNNMDLWTDITTLDKWVDIMVSPIHQKQFVEALEAIHITYEIRVQDVGAQITGHMKAIEKQQQKFLSSSKDSNDFDYGNYHTLDEINHWMNDIEAQYPKLVTVFNVTRSYQQRDIYAMKISATTSSKKPALWFDGGIHSREWISPATVIYIAYSLLSKYNVDPDVTNLLESFDVFILPVFNVDGYEYTWQKDRLWRKTRSPTIVPGCYGADPNRNWDARFCQSGASKDPCSDTYCGSKAFSEVEVKGVSEFLAKHNDTIVSYINFHAYSQLWMTPYGYTTQKPKDFTVQDTGSVASIAALSKLYGTQYQHGNIASTIYVASGSSVDWTYDSIGILYSYAVELRDQGQYGFLLPADQIIPSGLETFEAIKALAAYIKSRL